MIQKYEINLAIFNKLPGFILGYWLSKKIISHFENDKKIGEVGEAKQGLSTSDNHKFLRLWSEVSFSNISFDCHSYEETKISKTKWFPFNKAGYYRKWTPLNEYVVNYENDGLDIKKAVLTKYKYLKTPDFVVKNTNFYFKSGITWNDVSTGSFCARLVDCGYIFADSAPMYFCNNVLVILAFFNSAVFQKFADFICQGLHYSTGHIPQIPYVSIDGDLKIDIENIVNLLISESKIDSDAFETSWEFKKHPLI